MVTFHKVVGSVPATPDPDAIYFVRVGQGFDVWVTDSEGVPVRQNSNATPAPTIAFLTLPSLMGSTALGGTLTVSLGTAEGTPEPTIAGSILRAGDNPVDVTDGQLITIDQDDLGNAIVLTAVASNAEIPNGIQEAVTVQIPAIAPLQFAANAWSVTTGLEPLQIVLNVSALPFNGGSAITELQYNIGNGWVALSGPGTGARVLTMAAEGVEYDFSLRAVNAIDPGEAATVKSANSGATEQFAATAMWVGAVNTDSAMVSVYTEQGASNVQVFAVPVDGGAEIAGPVVAVTTIEAVLPATLYPSQNFCVARCTINNLLPDVKYDLGVRVNGRVSPLITGVTQTRPDVRKAFTFGFGTCFEMNTSRNYLNFDTMAAQDIDFFAVLDDRGYSDITVNDFRRYYRADWGYLHHPKIGPFHRAFPIYNVPGDHDFGADNSNAGSAGKPGFMQWYRNHAPQPVTLTGALDPVDYAVWIAPGLKLVMADTRTNRSGVMFMDAAQEARLIAHIQEVGAIPDAAMIWNSGTPWISDSADTDTWAGATAQRQRIADAVLQYAPGRVAIICGDMHALAFDDGRNSAGGMPVFHAAPMARANSSKGGPYSGGAPIIASQTQYGQMDCTPIENGWQLTFRGYSVDAAGVQTVALNGSATLVAPVQEAPAFTGTSVISGNATAGSVLSIDPGTFTGIPTPTPTFQWFVDDIAVPDATGQQFTRTTAIGSVPSVQITLDNDVEPNAVRTIAAAATTQAGSAQPGYFSNFSEFTAGPIASPWQERLSTGARPLSSRFVFAQVGGTMALTAPGSVPNDSAVALAGLTAGDSIRMFMQGETTYSGSSSLEWHIYSTASELFYRFDLNPVGELLRVRKFTGAGNGFDTLLQVTVPQDIAINSRVNILTEISQGVLRAKAWNNGTTEPVDWQLVHNDVAPIVGPFVAGVGCAANRPQPTIRQIGVGINGAPAPRAPV